MPIGFPVAGNEVVLLDEDGRELSSAGVGEIEATLLNLNFVKDGVVAVREDPTGDQVLVAYVVAKQTPGTGVSELRRRMSLQLPEAMVPSRFVLLESLPQAPNGKVDRQRLPDPTPARPELDTAFVAPRTPVEESLAEVWRDLLDLERIGVHDNFFDLGGHSLLATQLVARIRDAWRVDLPLRALFETPTVAELAELVSRERSRQTLSPAAPVTRVSRDAYRLRRPGRQSRE